MNTKFNFANLDDLKSKLTQLNISLPLSDNTAVLKDSICVNEKTIKNRIAIQPMEGCDGETDGRPSEITKRRYDRFAKSGAGLIWFEAVAITNDGRANPRQLFLNKNTLNEFKELVSQIKQTCLDKNGFEPVIIMQATHSGRYSKPNGVPEPIIAYNNPLFEKENPISEDRIITDDRLRELEIVMGNVAKMAQEAGFDGIDIKCCHRYLNSELLSAYTRKGEYGGSFENRTRFLINSIKNAQKNTSENFIVTSRLNIYDGFLYPYGFGVNENDGLTPDMAEPLKLVDILHNKLGVNLLDITIGNPYVNPHVNRPADVVAYECDENPLAGVQRMINCIKQIQNANTNLVIVGSGLTYLREFSANLAAGAIEKGYFTIAGFGRQAFAYPDFANDILKNGELKPQKCCITCSKCTELMRNGCVTGCVIRDKYYLNLYQEKVLKNIKV